MNEIDRAGKKIFGRLVCLHPGLFNKMWDDLFVGAHPIDVSGIDGVHQGRYAILIARTGELSLVKQRIVTRNLNKQEMLISFNEPVFSYMGRDVEEFYRKLEDHHNYVRSYIEANFKPQRQRIEDHFR